MSIYELNFAGGEDNFAEIVNGAVIKPLNAKFGERAFNLKSVTNEVLTVVFRTDENLDEVLARFSSKPPAALAAATPQRVRQIAKHESTLRKIGEINPEAVAVLRKEDIGSSESKTFEEISNF